MVGNGEIPAVLTIDFESFYAQTSRRMLPLAFSLTHSRVVNDRCVGAGIDDTVSSQVSNVLPVGNPAAVVGC